MEFNCLMPDLGASLFKKVELLYKNWGQACFNGI